MAAMTPAGAGPVPVPGARATSGSGWRRIGSKETRERAARPAARRCRPGCPIAETLEAEEARGAAAGRRGESASAAARGRGAAGASRGCRAAPALGGDAAAPGRGAVARGRPPGREHEVTTARRSATRGSTGSRRGRMRRADAAGGARGAAGAARGAARAERERARCATPRRTPRRRGARAELEASSAPALGRTRRSGSSALPTRGAARGRRGAASSDGARRPLAVARAGRGARAPPGCATCRTRRPSGRACSTSTQDLKEQRERIAEAGPDGRLSDLRPPLGKEFETCSACSTADGGGDVQRQVLQAADRAARGRAAGLDELEQLRAAASAGPGSGRARRRRPAPGRRRRRARPRRAAAPGRGALAELRERGSAGARQGYDQARHSAVQPAARGSSSRRAGGGAAARAAERAGALARSLPRPRGGAGSATRRGSEAPRTRLRRSWASPRRRIAEVARRADDGASRDGARRSWPLVRARRSGGRGGGSAGRAARRRAERPSARARRSRRVGAASSLAPRARPRARRPAHRPQRHAPARPVGPGVGVPRATSPTAATPSSSSTRTTTPSLLEDGEPKPVISGGEEDIANLALRLAISQMIAERAGQPLSLLVLDEIFGSLDEERRARVLDLLRSLADRFPQVILITHIESVREGFDRVIRVELRPGDAASPWSRDEEPTGATMWRPDRSVRGPGAAHGCATSSRSTGSSPTRSPTATARDGLVGRARAAPQRRRLALRDRGRRRRRDGLARADGQLAASTWSTAPAPRDGWGRSPCGPTARARGSASAMVASRHRLAQERSGRATIGLETMPRTVDNIGFYSRLGLRAGHLTVTLVRDAVPRRARRGARGCRLGTGAAASIEECRRADRRARAGRGLHPRDRGSRANSASGDTTLVRRNGSARRASRSGTPRRSPPGGRGTSCGCSSWSRRTMPAFERARRRRCRRRPRRSGSRAHRDPVPDRVRRTYTRAHRRRGSGCTGPTCG